MVAVPRDQRARVDQRVEPCVVVIPPRRRDGVEDIVDPPSGAEGDTVHNRWIEDRGKHFPVVARLVVALAELDGEKVGRGAAKADAASKKHVPPDRLSRGTDLHPLGPHVYGEDRAN